MKVGRPLSEDKAYAEDMGIGYRLVLRLGGAAKLKALAPEARRLLLRPLKPVKLNGWSLAHRGMKARKPHEVGEKFEAYLHGLMVERGLVKGA